FIMQHRNPHITARQLARQPVEKKVLPFRSVALYHIIKFWNRDAQEREHAPDTRDSAHVRPAYEDTRGRLIRYGLGQHGRRWGVRRRRCVLILVINPSTSSSYTVAAAGYRVAQVRAIFSLPIKARRSVFPQDDGDAPRYMAYVEWFMPFQDAAEEVHDMYRLTRMMKDGRRVGSVIPVENIRRSVHLFPRWG
ncbi:hypothetical protein BV25DRAFT_1783134, partial [Artomyces pyxidatus]